MAQQMTPEQQEEMRKKLESMSPEELRDFQKKQCIFCHIVSGRVNSKKIYEDDKVLGILDINPANPGHVLLMPKEHYMIMPQLPENELRHIFTVAKHISNALLKTLEVRGTNIIVANGPAAGQRAQHFMIHIIPREEGDGLEFSMPPQKHSEDELTQLSQLLRKRLSETLGIKEKELTAEEILKSSNKKERKDETEERREREAEERDDVGSEEEDSDDEENSERRKNKDDEKLTEKKENKNKEKYEDDAENEKEDEDHDDENEDDIDLDSIAKVLNGR